MGKGVEELAGSIIEYPCPMRTERSIGIIIIFATAPVAPGAAAAAAFPLALALDFDLGLGEALRGVAVPGGFCGLSLSVAAVARRGVRGVAGFCIWTWRYPHLSPFVQLPLFQSAQTER